MVIEKKKYLKQWKAACFLIAFIAMGVVTIYKVPNMKAVPIARYQKLLAELKGLPVPEETEFQEITNGYQTYKAFGRSIYVSSLSPEEIVQHYKRIFLMDHATVVSEEANAVYFCKGTVQWALDIIVSPKPIRYGFGFYDNGETTAQECRK